jgi:glycosyltransferase involved in cell wall biosynthesis
VNVGLVVPGFSADARDWCIPALRHLARTLAAGDNVRVIALRYPYAAGRYGVDGAEVIALGGALSHRAATFALWRHALEVLREEHTRRPFDVLHAFWATESGLLAAIAGRMLHVPTVVSLAGGELVALRDIGYGDQRIAWERLKVAASLRLATHVAAGSQQLQGLATRRLRNRLVHLAPLGVDTALFQPAPRADTAHRVIHVGTLVPVKDQATMLRAFSLVRRSGSDACLEVVGGGPLEQSLRRLATELGLDDSVRFRGEIDHAALPSVYRGASACVICSRHEAQCMVALEAASCGVRVVGTRVGVLPEITPAVVPVRDPVALADALAASLARSASAPEGTEGLRARFSLNACADRFRELYAR